MYVIRRVAKTEPGQERQVAALLTRICEAYQQAGRNKAQVYIGGRGLPGTPGMVYAEWTQERIEPISPSEVPESVITDNTKLQALLTEYPIEFYELVTPEKLREWGLA